MESLEVAAPDSWPLTHLFRVSSDLLGILSLLVRRYNPSWQSLIKFKVEKLEVLSPVAQAFFGAPYRTGG